MAAAKRKLAVNVLVRDPKTDEPVFLQAGQELPAAFKTLVAEVNLAPKQTASSNKKKTSPAADKKVTAPEQAQKPVAESDSVEEASEPTDVVDDAELDAGDSFDTE